MDWKRLKEQALLRGGRVIQEADPNGSYEQLTAPPGTLLFDAPETAYFCPISHLAAIKTQASFVPAFLCWEDGSEWKTLPRCNLLLMPDLPSAIDFFRFLHSELCRDARLGHALGRLISLRSASVSLEEFTNEISAMYRSAPVFVMDCTASLLACSHIPPEHPLHSHLTPIIESGHIPADILAQTTRRSQSVPEAPTTHVFEDLTGSYTTYHTPILADNSVIGYLDLHLPPSESLSFTERSTLSQTSALLSLYLQQNGSPLSADTTPGSQLLSAALWGSGAPEQLESRLSGVGCLLRPRKRLLVLHSDTPGLSSSALTLLSRSIRALFGESLCAVHEQTLTFLYSYSSVDPLSAETLESWESYLSHNRLRVGVSTESRTLERLREMLAEAQRALDMAALFFPARRVCLFDRLRGYSQVVSLTEHLGDELFLCYYPPVSELLDYDNAHGTELTRTLYLLLRHPGDQATVCRKLHIHKNTFYARIHRLQDFLPRDFTTIDIAAQIYTTFLLLHRAGKLYFELETELLP